MRKSFTLIEIIEVIAIVGIVSLILGGFIVQAVDTWQFIDTRAEIASEGKKTLDWMVREISQIKDKYSINVAQKSKLKFVNSSGDTVQFSYPDPANPQTIDYQINTQNEPLCDNVSNLTFKYYDKTGNELSPPLNTGQRQQVRRIKITIDLSLKGRTIGFSSEVIPRSLYD